MHRELLVAVVDQTLLNRNRVSCLTMPFTFTTEEYADMVFICVVCEGNATAAVAEYHRRYPHRRIPNPKTISGFNTLRHTATLPSFHTPYKRSPQHNVAEEENILDIVQRSPLTSTRRVARRLGVTLSMVWRTLLANELYLYHLKEVKYLEPQDYAHRVEFCTWLNGNGREFPALLCSHGMV